jgi:hypothetical protein
MAPISGSREEELDKGIGVERLEVVRGSAGELDGWGRIVRLRRSSCRMILPPGSGGVIHGVAKEAGQRVAGPWEEAA